MFANSEDAIDLPGLRVSQLNFLYTGYDLLDKITSVSLVDAGYECCVWPLLHRKVEENASTSLKIAFQAH